MKLLPPEYINSDGFVTVQPNAAPVPGEGNGWLQTGLAWWCGMYDEGVLDTMIARCRMNSAEPLIWRSPYKKNPGDETQVDDYWGVCPMASEWSKELLAYAEQQGWNFDVGGQRRFQYWFGRFPAFAPFLRSCAQQKLSRLDKVRMALTTVWDSYHLDQADANMKAYCLLREAEWSGGSLCTAAAALWRRRVRAKYITIGGSWSAYFGEAHPLSSYDEGSV